MASSAPAPQAAPPDKGLRAGTLGYLSSVVIAAMHERYRTPGFATVTIGLVSSVFFAALASVSKNVLADSASAVGLLIAFYYGLTGLACVWTFRRDLGRSRRDLWGKGILPLLGAAALFAAFVLSVKSYFPAASSASSAFGIGGVFLIGAGSLAVGVILMIAMNIASPAFFRPTPLTSAAEPTPTTLDVPERA